MSLKHVGNLIILFEIMENIMHLKQAILTKHIGDNTMIITLILKDFQPHVYYDNYYSIMILLKPHICVYIS